MSRLEQLRRCQECGTWTLPQDLYENFCPPCRDRAYECFVIPFKTEGKTAARSGTKRSQPPTRTR